MHRLKLRIYIFEHLDMTFSIVVSCLYTDLNFKIEFFLLLQFFLTLFLNYATLIFKTLISKILTSLHRTTDCYLKMFISRFKIQVHVQVDTFVPCNSNRNVNRKNTLRILRCLLIACIQSGGTYTQRFSCLSTQGVLRYRADRH